MSVASIAGRRGVWKLVPDAWATQLVRGKWFVQQARVSGLIGLLGGLLILLALLAGVLGQE